MDTAEIVLFEAGYAAARQAAKGLGDDVLQRLENFASDDFVRVVARDELDVRDHVMTVGCLG